MSAAIDLSRLPAPDIIEALDYETILAEQIATVTEMNPALDALLESDPAMTLLQGTAMRELLLRQRVNEAARALLLAYAQGSNLEHLGALLDLPRLVLTEAIPDRNIAAVMESDPDYRERIQLAPQSFSVAGPAGAYCSAARKVDGRVLDAGAFSPSPCQVMVTVLSRTGNGTATPDLLALVETHLRDNNVRPMTDYVTVQSAVITSYRIRARLVTFRGPDLAVVLNQARKRIAEYTRQTFRLGQIPAFSGICAALHVAGVQRVILEEPAEELTITHEQAAWCDGIEVESGGTYE